MIDMVKRRFANEVEGVYTQKKIDEDYFCGYVCNIKIKNIKDINIIIIYTIIFLL